jgi:hypothetical protein
MGPTHNLFTLHTLQARFCRPDQKPLYVCFVDFVKAFDMVRRDLLWFRLEALGLKGQFLDALRAMYADVTFRVHVKGKLGALFESLSGVKQGDPLSPTLFGLFIEALPEFLEAMHAAEPRLMAAGAPKLTDSFTLFYMLFADDLTLISHTRQHMQAMLDALSKFCAATGMDVNVEKTECMIMGSAATVKATRRTNFKFRDSTIRNVTSAKYLGLMFGQTGSTRVMTDALVASAQRCRFALQNRLKPLHITPALQVDLFNATCRSVLTYGGQVWGVSYLDLPTEESVIFPSSPLEAVQLDFLRQLTCVGPGTPNWCLVDDCGAHSIQSHLAKMVCSFWNAMRCSDDDSMLSASMVADVHLMTDHCRTCWTYKVCRFLVLLSKAVPQGRHLISERYWSALLDDPSPHHHQWRFLEGSREYFINLKINVPKVLDRLAAFWRARIDAGSKPEPLTAPRGVVATYVHFVGPRDPKRRRRPHMTSYLPRKQFKSLCRLRHSSWRALSVNAGRGSATARPDRVCPHCLSLGRCCPETEHHVLYDCPLYGPLRAQIGSPLFSHGRPFHLDPTVVMNSPRQGQLAEFADRAVRVRATAFP